jgi:hypothetical protein
VALSLACGAKRILMPARVDLRPHGRLALVTFTIENAQQTARSRARREAA